MCVSVARRGRLRECEGRSSTRRCTCNGLDLYSERMTTTLRAIGYVRVSTDEQARSGLGLEAQEQAIRAAAEQRGWELVDVITDAGLSGRKANRPGLVEAKARMKRREADLLVVAKLDRLSRSVRDGANTLEVAEKQGWGLVDLGSGVDMSIPEGVMVANMLMAAAQYEAQIGGVRTKEGLAAAKARGVKLGRQTAYPDALLERIRGMHQNGMPLRGIADALTADGVTTARGGRWHASSVRSVLRSGRMAALTGS